MADEIILVDAEIIKEEKRGSSSGKQKEEDTAPLCAPTSIMVPINNELRLIGIYQRSIATHQNEIKSLRAKIAKSKKVIKTLKQAQELKSN